jgi:NACHT domain/Trypsin-like peptidase domain
VALWPRQLVKVRAGKRGSGWAVGRSGVLTALHVVQPHLDNPYDPADHPSGVRCLAVTGGPADEDTFDCTVVWQDEAADLALLQIAKVRRDVWKARLANEAATVLAAPGTEALSDTDPLSDVSAIGFPDAALATDANRPDPDQLAGTLLPGSGPPGRIGVDVSTSTPEGYPLWRGLSGAAVREPGSGRLLAIVTQAVPGRGARLLYASPLPDPEMDRGWAAALTQVEATPILEDRRAPEARRFLICHDPAGRPWPVGRVPQLGDFGVRLARDDLAPDNQPYFPFVGRPEADSVEAALNAALANVGAPRMILLVGESAVGKSRLAAEVVTRMPALAEHRFIRPVPTERAGDLPEEFWQGRRVLLWLDDLHRYLASGLDPNRARLWLTNAQLVIVATVLREKLNELDSSGFRTAATDLLDDESLIARIAIADTPSWSVDGGADPADARAARAALAAAGHAGVGLGEYLAAYAELRKRYRNAGPWARALIDCVADWSRTGMPAALPESRARELWQAYLSEKHAQQWELKTDDGRQSIYQAALKEATTEALGSTALLADTRHGLSPSEVAILERHAVDIPCRIWKAAAQIAAENPAQADSVAFQAELAGQHQLAVSLWTAQGDREPRALFNLGLVGRLRLARQTYMRKAGDEPQTAGSEVVGRDALCNVIIEELNDPGIRRPHVVIGGGGAGKTALLIQLTKLLAERGVVVPVPVRLRDARESLNFRELARKRFVAETDNLSLSSTEGEALWRELWRTDQVVVLADGLEEALIEGKAQNERDDLIRIAIRQANAQRLPLVLTSRPHDSLRDLEAEVVELEPLSEEAALEYLGQWESGEDSRRLGWIVETADVAESPLYLQITHQLHYRGLLEPSSAGQHGVVDTRGADRATLRLGLLQTWERALIQGHLYEDIPLNRAERQAAVEQLSLLACAGLQQDGLQVRFEQAESLRADPPPAIIAEVDERLGRLNRGYDFQLAADWGSQLGLVEARGDGVRFPHGIIQAYLASRLIDVAMADPGFRDQTLAKSRDEFLIALVMHSRARPQTPRSNSAARGSRPAAQPGAAERTPQELLCEEASRRTDVKALDLYAAALQIASVENQPAHSDIAEKLAESWPDITARDQRTLEKAKLNVVHRFGEAARTISEQRRHGQGYPAEPAYLPLYRIGCLDSSYPIRLACAQELGAGGDEAFDALAGALGPPVADRPKGHATARAKGPGTAADTLPPRADIPGLEEDQAPEDRAWNEGVVRAWLAPLLVGSVTNRKSAANKNLEQWLQYLGKSTHTRAEPGLCLSLEIALAQGFKHAANRRRRHPHAQMEAQAYLAEQAREMLRDSRFWFTRLTLLHAMCLWSLRDERPGQRDRRHVDYRALVNYWVTFRLGVRQHPFVKEAGKLAALALETGHPERFIWIDESGLITKVGARPINLRAPCQRNLWIPPSTGWTTLDPRAQQLVADVNLLLNLAERGGRPSERNRRLHRIDRPDLPPCLDEDRSPLDPTRTVGTAETLVPGSNCKDGCPFGLCPYPSKGETSYRTELSEAFCRSQQALISGGSIRRRAAPWRQKPPGNLKQFWKQMEQRARSV